MKYAIIIPDGAADRPLEELGGKTPLQAARTPNMDRIAQEGRQGLVHTIPNGFESGSDVAIMCLLGYDPKVYHTGRAPLEAAAQNIPLAASDWVFRCNLVTVADGLMKDHSAGGITDAEAQKLLGELARAIDLPGWEFHLGVSYRNLLVYRGSEALEVSTKPPHEIFEEPINRWLPKGRGSDLLNQIMRRSAELFENHEINQVRRQTGLNPASQVWLWGQGHAPNMPRFSERFGVGSGCMITSVDLLRGLGVLLGWQLRQVEGMSSFHDTNYVGQGLATADALDQADLVFSHIEAPDEASHQADTATKIASIEHIDRHIVGPVLKKMEQFKEWRVLVMPDHPTHIATRKHGSEPVPFAMCGTRVYGVSRGGYCEANAATCDLKITRGHELMEYFLHGGS